MPQTLEELVAAPVSQDGTLFCDSMGDRRFSSHFAEVQALGVHGSIERHYQLVKRFGANQPAPIVWTDAVGLRAESVYIAGFNLPPARLTSWAYYLWMLYFDAHPELVEHATHFTAFEDRARSGHIDCIRDYAAGGHNGMLPMIQPLIDALSSVGYQLPHAEPQ